ncbi:MAG: HAD-IA family hydrolase [Desertifilum sp. SIO1I2]|nr:HAD-IA family hydrolase [Desertifilum sp. SIO1I2]
MSIKVILFDFDGTLADTLDAIVRITNRLADEFGYQPTSPEDVVRLKQLTSREVIRQSGVSVFKLPFLLRKVRSELNQEIHLLAPIPGIREVLLELKAQGNQLGIVTSNAQENVLFFLENNKLQNIFDFVYSEMKLFGKSRVIKHFLKQANLHPQEVVYVGDETRDIEAAQQTGIPAIAVSWGFNSPAILAKHHPDFLIHSPEELTVVIRQLKQLKMGD